MPLVNAQISNLVNGVSQQAETLRLASQGDIQENGISSVSQGLLKRPGSVHVKQLSGSTFAKWPLVHVINRDETERYMVAITDVGVQVWDLDGNPRTVSPATDLAYLNCASPRDDLRAVTVADYTFIVNKTKTVAKAATTNTPRLFEAIVVVKNGLYGKNYTINTGGSLGTHSVTYATPDGSVASDVTKIGTDYIATQLAAALVAAGVGNTRSGSTIYINNVSDFTISTSDDYNNAGLQAYKDTIQSFASLPANGGPDGFTIKVVGDTNSASDDYWVKFTRGTSGTSSGVWKETAQPGSLNALDKTTMPHALIRNADGSFTFKPLDWSTRNIGDDTSAPFPSMVGKQIADIFFYRNRLGLCAEESVLFSEAGEFFNFFPTTVIQLLDSDPIDVQVSHTKVSNIFAAVPFDKKLLLFSSQTQFSVESGDILTQKTISIQPTTEFECSTLAHPVSVGSNIYFAFPRGQYTGIREYYVDENTAVNDSTDVSGHIPKYISSGVFRMDSALNEDFLALQGYNEPYTLSVYKFYWDNNQKLQSAWSKFLFDSSVIVLGFGFIESRLYMMIQRDNTIHLEFIDISATELLNDGTASPEPYLVRLDRKQIIPKASLTYSGGRTSFPFSALGYTPTTNLDQYMAVSVGGGTVKPGVLEVATIDVAGHTVSIPGNFTASDLVFGRKFLFRYRFSTLYPRSRDSQGERVDTSSRIQLRRMTLNYNETGYFKAVVTPIGRQPYITVFSGHTLGLLSSTIGEVNLESGVFPVQILCRNIDATIELQSDHPMPCAFLSADWEGYYVKRSQAI